MKRTLLIALALLLLPAAGLAQKTSELKYVDAQNLMLINHLVQRARFIGAKSPDGSARALGQGPSGATADGPPHILYTV